MGEWLEIPAEDFCESVRDGTHDSPKPVEDGRYLITSRHIIGARIDLSKAYRISQADFDDVNRRSKVDRWDVLITMIGTVGDVCLVREKPNFAIKNIGLFKTKSENSGKWLYYYMKSPLAKELLKSFTRGTTQGYVPLGELRRFPIKYPQDETILEEIVSLLASIDDKIEMNRRTNETLEAMARALFKDWFVDFGPTRAKMEGRDPYLAPEIWELFPDALDDDGKPVGWELEPLYEQSNWVNGAAYKNMHFSDAPDALPVIKIAELKAGITGNTKFTNTDLGEKFRIDSGQLLFSWSGNPDTSIDAFIWVGGAAWLNQHIFAVRPNGNLSKAALFAMLKTYMPDFAEIARNKQTTGLGHVTKADMQRMTVLLGSAEIRSAFEEIVAPLYDQLVANLIQIKTLAHTRDFLLPKLMSGEIGLRDAEKEVEAVA